MYDLKPSNQSMLGGVCVCACAYGEGGREGGVVWGVCDERISDRWEGRGKRWRMRYERGTGGQPKPRRAFFLHGSMYGVPECFVLCLLALLLLDSIRLILLKISLPGFSCLFFLAAGLLTVPGAKILCAALPTCCCAASLAVERIPPSARPNV